MSIRSCSDAELYFEMRLRESLSCLSDNAASFHDFLDGTCGVYNGVHPEWEAIESDLFEALDECVATIRGIRKGVFESATGEYSGRVYD